MNGSLSLVSDVASQSEGRLLRHARWLCRIRLGLGLSLLAGVLIGWRYGLLPEPLSLLLIAVGILAYDALFAMALRSLDDSAADRVSRLCAAQTLADALSLTVLIFYCGGVENPIVIFYVGPVATAGLLLPRKVAYFVAALALASFSAVAVLQATVESLHHPLPFDFPGLHYQRWSFIGFVVGIIGLAMFLAAYATTTLRARLTEAEAHVTGSRDVLNAIISCMTEAVIFLSPEGRALLVNPAFRSHFMRPGGLVGDEFPPLPDEIRSYVDRFRRSVEPLGPETFPLALPADGPGRPARRYIASASSVHDALGSHLGYVVVAEDVTEQWLLEQDLRARNREITAMSDALQRSQREMAQREKMAAIGTMAAGIAHEIGNPLAGLSAVIELLKRRHPRPEQLHHLKTVHTQVGRIARIVRQLVEFARPASPERSLVDLDALIEETLVLLHYSHRGRRGEIQSIRNAELPPVLVNPQQFQQVLLNLLLNALDAVEEADGQQAIRIDRRSDEGWVRVSVRDWGCGMSPEHLRMAFEPFFTTKPPNRGTGLGLAVSSRLVESHGGSIHIDSTLGQGTTVTVSFPAAGPARVPDAPAGQAGR